MSLRILYLMCIPMATTLACQDISPDDGLQLNFDDIRQAQCISYDSIGTVLFEYDSTWSEFWAQNCHWRNDSGPLPPPQIDFNSEIVAAVFWGQHYSGCSNWAPSITGVKKYSNEIVVFVGPMPNIGDCTAITYPLHVIKFQRFDLPVRFENYSPP